ncbi:MAG: hypothetical protein JST59_15190 [Actinobacteria bacterium]|nr:hypothetical protein [Actinomycetota bacterium]
MSQHQNLVPRPDPVPRLLSAAALLVAVVALVFSMSGLSAGQGAGKVVTLDKKGKIPARYIPTVPTAENAQKLAGAPKGKFTAACPVSGAIDLGSWCLEGSTFKVPPSEAGQNDYVYAAQKCVQEGGWLPSAAQLIGAAPEAALKSTLNDDPGTSGASEFPEAAQGIKDEREMTSDLFTTAPGLRAAGSEGVSAGSKGVGNIGEPNPVPVPAEPLPETLAYVTVFDNHNMGGFAGGAPVGKPENFRCAYAKGYQGKPRDISSRS